MSHHLVDLMHIKKDIDLAARSQVEELRLAYGQELSAYAFLSLYLWQKPMGLSLYMDEDMYTARISKFGSNTWFFPCGSADAVLRFLREQQETVDFALCYLREKDVCFLQEHFSDMYRFVHDSDSSEYIYDCEGHRTLCGKPYANVRTQLHKIEREHELVVETITDQNISACISVIQKWESLRETEWSEETVQVDLMALKEYASLGMDGILVWADEQPAGVAVGYPLTTDTYDLFLAKADHSIPGLGYYVQRAFFLSRPEGVRWINMEEDLGIGGLRNMKKRLAPVRMNELWSAYRK